MRSKCLFNARRKSANTALEGDPVEVVLTPNDEGRATRVATLEWRARGTSLYYAAPFAPDGRYWRARFPSDAVRSPGLDYFVELVSPAGTTTLGDGEHPRSVDVSPRPGAGAPPRADRSRIGLWYDFVDWNHFAGNDWENVFEGEFL